MRSLALLLALCGTALAKPAWRPPPPRIDAPELVARLEEAIRNRDVKAIETLLGNAPQFDGLWFPDASCAKRFGKRGTAEKSDIRTLARCFAQLKPIATTRRSSLSGGAIMTFEPGVEIELAFRSDHVAYAASLWPRDTDRGAPTLTMQALEALRTAGTTQLDTALATKLTGDASAWIKVCLDAKGTVSTFVAEAKPNPAAGEAFVAAIADWSFKPFRRGTPACGFTLLTYPATKAPATEVLPPPPAPVSSVSPILDEIENPFNFDGVSINGTPVPTNVPPSQLERNRIRGTKQIDPDAVTKVDIAKAGKSSVVASFKLCVDTNGRVSTVSMLKSSGFVDYDVKLEREMRRWAYAPFMLNGAATAVCTAVTFIYRPKP